MKVAGRACAQAGRRVITGHVRAVCKGKFFIVVRIIISVVDIVFATITVHHILMTMLARVILAEVVMNNADTMVILIVQICRQAVEPPEVPLSSRLATATTTSPATATPSSSVNSLVHGAFFVRHSRAATRESIKKQAEYRL